MCLITTQSVPTILKKDKIVYKLLCDDYRSKFYKDYLYVPRILNTTEIKIAQDGDKWAFDKISSNHYFDNDNEYNFQDLRFYGQGFHSINSLERYFNYIKNHPQSNDKILVKCIIPKGSEIYEDETGLLVSNKIIVTDNVLNNITPENIVDLRHYEVFVFGSNTGGIHGAGAAYAALQWGAEMHNGYGLQGNTYAIPTKFALEKKGLVTMTIDEIQPYVDKFITFAKSRPDKHFLVTKIGTGLAGILIELMAPLFKDAIDMKNISLPYEFIDQINK